MNEDSIIHSVQEAGFDVCLAVATEAETKEGAACGQMSLIAENID